MALTLPEGAPGRCPTHSCGHVLDDHKLVSTDEGTSVYKCLICAGASLCRQQPPPPIPLLDAWVGGVADWFEEEEA